MRRLYLRIYAVVLSVLLAFAALAVGVFQYHAQAQSEQEQAAWLDLTGGWVDPALAPFAEADAPLGQRLWWVAASLAALLALVGLASYPLVRSLTRRLELLRTGVQAFGDGALQRRVAVQGHDEVAALAASFNAAAARIEALVRAQQRLLANASHELRSPLARLKLALELLDATEEAETRARHRAEIQRSLAELDALVDEVLLAARLETTPNLARQPQELLALVAEEAAWFDAEVSGAPVTVQGDERLLRRAVRNLLDNARRYAPEQPPQVRVQRGAAGQAQVWVCDRGPGVPADARERIFEPFFRLPGHAEARGGVGLGLALVRQIAQLHGGHVHCEEHRGGGSCFVLSLPADDPPPQPISRANASR